MRVSLFLSSPFYSFLSSIFSFSSLLSLLPSLSFIYPSLPADFGAATTPKSHRKKNDTQFFDGPTVMLHLVGH